MISSNSELCALFYVQVRPHLRTAITIPHQSWKKFRDVLSEFVESSSKVNSTTVNGTGEDAKPAVNGDSPAVDGNDASAAAPAAAAASN